MTSQPSRPIEVFFSYAHEDEELRDQLATQLKALESDGLIQAWHDRGIIAGQKWGDEIDARLKSADIILLLVSPDFLASDYCRTVEVKRAMERDAAGEACVIPIILRPCQWSRTILSKLQVLPKDGKPVSLWPTLDEAFLDVANGICRAIDELRSSRDARRETPDEKQDTATSAVIPRPPVFGFVVQDDSYTHDLFISYNRADEEWAKKLATRVEQEKWGDRNLVAFFAPWDIRPGESVDERLDRALAKSRYVGLVLSQEAVNSQWVSEEWYSAHHANMNSRERRLIPLYLSDCEIPHFIAHLNRIDFREDDKFEEGVRLLLAAIKGEPLPRGEVQTTRKDISHTSSINPIVRTKFLVLEQLVQEKLIDESMKQEYRRKILDKLLDID